MPGPLEMGNRLQVGNRIPGSARPTGDGSVPADGAPDPRRWLFGRLSMAEARLLVADLVDRRMGLYWLDFAGSLVLGYGSFVALSFARGNLVLRATVFLVSALALYRAALFTHEISHMPPARHGAFRVDWNLLCGIPLLVPSFMYEMHPEHHGRSYGTDKDGEYVEFTSQSRWFMAGLLLSSPLALPALAARFLLLAPLGWLIPPLRRVVLMKASALIIDGGYVRSLPTGKAARRATLQEIACFCYCGALLFAFLTGMIPTSRLVEAWVVVTAVVFVNFARVLGAHRYEGAGTPMSFSEQVVDSVDYPSGVLAELWAPLGLRYHAVHHLFPNLPYHALPEAHRRLARALPPDAAYRCTSERGLLAVLWKLVAVRRGDKSLAGQRALSPTR